MPDTPDSPARLAALLADPITRAVVEVLAIYGERPTDFPDVVLNHLLADAVDRLLGAGLVGDTPYPHLTAAGIRAHDALGAAAPSPAEVTPSPAPRRPVAGWERETAIGERYPVALCDDGTLWEGDESMLEVFWKQTYPPIPGSPADRARQA